MTVEVLKAGSDMAPICCGQPMTVMPEQTAEYKFEKHVPFPEVLPDMGFRVLVGKETDHPMTEDHHIEWIEVEDENCVVRKYLAPGEQIIADTGVKIDIEDDGSVFVFGAEEANAKAAIARRCDVCHNGRQRLPHTLSDENGISFWIPNMNDPRLTKTHRYLLFNISRPEKSLFLRAPLAKEAGGLGLKMTKDGKPVFASKDDPDYKLILAMIEDGKKVLDTVKRFDMPGFRPPLPYLREMMRYGVLPWNFDLEHDPVDPYALDRRYWDLDWTQLK